MNIRSTLNFQRNTMHTRLLLLLHSKTDASSSKISVLKKTILLFVLFTSSLVSEGQCSYTGTPTFTVTSTELCNSGSVTFNWAALTPNYGTMEYMVVWGNAGSSERYAATTSTSLTVTLTQNRSNLRLCTRNVGNSQWCEVGPSLQVTVHSASQFTLSGNSSGSKNVAQVFNTNHNYGAYTTASWSKTGSPTTNYANFSGNNNIPASYTWSTDGVYTVCVTLSRGSCTYSDCESITIGNPCSHPTSYSITNAGSMCSGTSKVLTASHSGGTGTASYQWQYLNGSTWTNTGSNSSTLNTGNLTSSRTYRVRITHTAGNTCAVWTSNATVSVTTCCSNPTSASISGQGTICSGGSDNLTASYSGGSGTVSYQWQYLNGSSWINTGSNSSTLNTGTLTSSRTYRVIVYRGGSCSRTSSSATVTVNSDISTTHPSDGESCSGFFLSLPGTTAVNELSVSVSGGVGNSTQWQSSANTMPIRLIMLGTLHTTEP